MEQLDLFTGENCGRGSFTGTYNIPAFSSAEELDTYLGGLSIMEIGFPLVADKMKLQPRGPNYYGKCVFHSENTPSFLVRPHYNDFVCFGCQTRGGAMKLDFEMGGKLFSSLVEAFGLEEYSNPGLYPPYDFGDSRFAYAQEIHEDYLRERRLAHDQYCLVRGKIKRGEYLR